MRDCLLNVDSAHSVGKTLRTCEVQDPVAGLDASSEDLERATCLRASHTREIAPNGRDQDKIHEDALPENLEGRAHSQVSDTVEAVLRGEGLPNLTTLTIKFVPEFGGRPWEEFTCMYVDGEGDVDDFLKPESDVAVDARAAEFQSRATLAHVFAAAASNPSIKHLTLIDIPPKRTSVWRSRRWANFVGSLDSFEAKLWSGPVAEAPEDAFCLSTREGYRSFVQSLGSEVFAHLHSVRDVVFRADSAGPVGAGYLGPLPIALAHDAMQQIRFLHLEYCILEPKLLDFLQSRSQHLRTPRLTDCACYLPDNGDNWSHSNSWACLFAGLRAAHPVLTELTVHNDFSENKVCMNADVSGTAATVHRRPLVYVSDCGYSAYPGLYGLEHLFFQRHEHGELDALTDVVQQNRISKGMPPLELDVVG